LPLQSDTTKKVATNRQLGAALLPLLHESKIRLEVLRLELVGTNSRISFKASLTIKINSRFEEPNPGAKEQRAVECA
jgi:hypothetical protein